MCNFKNYFAHILFIPDIQNIHITFPPMSVPIAPVHFAPFSFSEPGVEVTYKCPPNFYFLAYNYYTDYTDLSKYIFIMYYFVVCYTILIPIITILVPEN